MRSTIELAHNMGLTVVAEGVEDAHALAMLEGYRCDMVQGYLISPPRPASEIPAIIRKFDADAVAAAVQRDEVEYEIALPGDGAESEVYFSDLGHEYVTINADYTT